MTDNEIIKSADNETVKQRVKAIYPHITVSGAIDKPYYNIDWYDIEKNTMYRGFSSYNLELVHKWLEEEFEVVEADIDDLINRQKAKIEALIAGQETLQKYRDEEINRLEIELKAMRGAANSYKAEIERLQRENEETQEKLEALLCEATGGKLSKYSYTAEVITTQAHEHLLNCCEDERAEAVKEFAERYERYLLSQLTSASLDKKEWINFCLEELDNLKKEMVGE